MSRDDYISIGSGNDWYNMFLIREGEYITLKYVYEETYETMEDYIRDRVDLEDEWRDDVYNGHTTQSYEDWVSDYEFQYWDYFNYDGVLDIYYDEDSDYYRVDDFYCGAGSESREDMIDKIMETFESDYDYNGLNWDNGMTLAILRDKVAQFYDDTQEYIKEREESRKPHWKAFSYYK